MDLYDELGVKRYINALATVTILGGSIMPEEVVDAMRDASKSFVFINELQRKAGDYIAKITKNEAAYIANSATAGILLCVAACIAGDDPAAREKLPRTDGMANEVVYAGSCHGYDAAIRAAGGVPVCCGDESKSTAAQMEAAITDKTAAIIVFYFQNLVDGHVTFTEQIKIAKKHGLPLIVDAAAQLPLKEKLWTLTEQGADAVIFSGGKGLRGPQCTGLIVGKRLMIDRVTELGSPNQGIGRSMKVGKEEIAGLTAAVRLYMRQDETAELQKYETMVQTILNAFKGYAGVSASRGFPSDAWKPLPNAILKIDGGLFAASPSEMNEQLRQEDPCVYLRENGGAFVISMQTLEEGEVEIVVGTIKKILDKNRL